MQLEWDGKHTNNMKLKNWLIIVIFMLSTLLFALTSAGNTAFNHFTLLADAFINGRIYIEGDMPWLEQIPLSEGKFFVANPPMPAIVSILPVFIFGKDLPQQYISFIVGAIAISLTALISLRIKNDYKLAIWSSILFGFGSLNWYLITVGSTWYIAQVIGQMFLLSAIYSQLKNKSPFLTGLFLGFAYFSRIPMILTFFFFLINLPKLSIKNILLLGLGVAPSIGANALYNYARFGVIWDIGYTLIGGISSDPWFHLGIMHPSYIIEHIKIIFGSIPSISNEYPYLVPSEFGYAIWFTTPAFVFALYNKIINKDVWSSWLSITFVSILIFLHGTTGFTQFGYRFAADFYPILIYLTIKGVANKGGPVWYHWVLLLIGVVVNFWGVLFLNILR
jgi:hypothetical protein